VKYCPRCGSKLGFFSKPVKCEICGRAFCMACSEFRVNTIERGRDVYHNVCSSECLLELYRRYLQSIEQDKELILLNGSNTSIMLYDDVDNPSIGIYMIYLKVNLREINTTEENLISELVPIYGAIREDLKRRGVRFKEEFESIV